MTTDPNATEPTANADSSNAPVEEMRPLVTAEPNTEPENAQSNAQSSDAAAEEEQRPPTPAEMDCFECRSCGYTYEPTKGDSRTKVPVGVPFRELAKDWRCPVCGASTSQFSNVGPVGTASGFKQNLSYGFGVNTLTPGQKNLLIFGALGIAVLFFLSLYGLR